MECNNSMGKVAINTTGNITLSECKSMQVVSLLLVSSRGSTFPMVSLDNSGYKFEQNHIYLLRLEDIFYDFPCDCKYLRISEHSHVGILVGKGKISCPQLYN